MRVQYLRVIHLIVIGNSFDMIIPPENINNFIWMNKSDQKQRLIELYAGILFIGIFLSFLFIMATILIMYYKQITEGYEDKDRFEIMQK